jgi:hypothetical protein
MRNAVPMSAKIETLFACLIVLQLAVVVSHDWIDIRGWTHGRQVQAVVGRGKLALATAINAVFPALAVGSALWFWGRSEPKIVGDYWVIYCGLAVLSAVTMWYVPYFFGADEKKKGEYSRMYAGTRHIFPARDDNPRPNLLHVLFHLLFLVNFGLALVVRFRAS